MKRQPRGRVFRLHVLQARFGDCLVLEFGSKQQPKFALIDGGPRGTYEAHLRPYLQRLAEDGRRLEFALLSHVDNDHVYGLLELLSELRAQRDRGTAALVGIGGLWHNAFTQGASDPQVAPLLRATMAGTGPETASAMGRLGATLQGIAEGNQLRVTANLLGIPVNAGFPNGELLIDTAPAVSLENLTLRVLGPSRANLEELRQEWLAWLDKHADEIGRAEPTVAARVDRSVPNLSSIILLAEADGRTILLTGDGRGDHILDGLQRCGFLRDGGRLHVSVLKLPHHGSERNVDADFLRTVTADTYVISADGRFGNPDLNTLVWIVDAAHADARRVNLVFTNETPSTRKLRTLRPPKDFGYRTRTLPQSKSFLTLRLA